MRKVSNPAVLRRRIAASRRGGATVGFVPTMGALHAGHLSLAAYAREETDVVVMSVFVNPTQFGPGEDLERYPRDVERDAGLARASGVDLLFLPSVATMYPAGPDGQAVWIDPGPMAHHLEGAARPGHFRGVATVVVKLLNLVQPDRVYFGQKDIQQALVVERVLRELAYGVEMRIVPTEREADGLALSSRNVYLDGEERREAAALFASLTLARESIAAGERDAGTIERAMLALIARDAPRAVVEYVTVAGLADLVPIAGAIDRDAVISLAVRFGTTRLIDNIVVRFTNGKPGFS